LLQQADVELVEVSATKMAAELGDEQVTNIILFWGVLELSHFEAALKTILPEEHHKHMPLNSQTIDLGVQRVS